MNILILHK